MKIKILISLSCLIIALNSFGQDADSITIFKKKIIEGYFVCIRDSIQKTDYDVTSSHYDFRIFYFINMNDSLIETLNKIKLSKSGYTLISGGISYDIGESKLHKQYINYLISNDLFSKAHDYRAFDLGKVDRWLIDSDNPLVVIFKGKLTVVGPFLPNLKLIDLIEPAKQDLYMYLPDSNNSMTYICTLLY